MARCKTKKAECTSDLNSEIEMGTKRKITKNRIYDSDSDDYNQSDRIPIKQKQIKGLCVFK